jgi:hypothetical protein
VIVMDSFDVVEEDLPERTPVTLREVIAGLYLTEHQPVRSEDHPHEDHHVRPAA